MAEAVVTGVTKGVDKLESYFKKCFERADLVRDNKKKLNRLLLRHRNALDSILEAENTWIQDRDIRRRLEEYKTELEANLKDLESRKNNVENANCMSRVKRMRSIMTEYQRLVTEAREYYACAVRPALERNTDAEVTRDGSPNVIQPRGDRYIRANNAPLNPPRVTLDYGDKDTYEGRLKAEILSSLQNRDRIVGVLGLGGVGKTCALRGLASDKEMQVRFPDGFLFIQLGNDSVLSDMIMGIAHSVDSTGGRRLARKIRRLKTVEEAVDRASRWFESRKCLFLVDDIWEVSGITPQELRRMGAMLSDGSLLVLSSRSKGLADGVDREVLFKEREAQGEFAQRMLMNHANCTYSKLSSKEKEAVQGVLEICRGLPLALGIAGAAVRGNYYRDRLNSEYAWRNYCHDLKSKDENIVTKKDRLYGPLTRIVDRSLKVLESESRNGKCFTEMFRGFCVVQKQQIVGGQMLRRLWGLEDLRQVREIAELFESVSVVRLLSKKGKTFSIQIHDLVLDIAKQMASGSETIEWFRRLLSNYIQSKHTGTAEAEISAAEEERVSFRPWWTIEDDGFIYDNLCRVLQGADETEELIWLLERAQWVVMRLQRSGISGVERDLEIGMQAAEKNGFEDTELMSFLKLVGSAARKSCVSVVENTGLAWYQMYGRVLWYADHCKRTRMFTSEIQENAPRPWVRPSVGFLSEAGGAELESIPIEDSFEIRCIYHGQNIVRILWEDTKGNSSVTEYDRRSGRKNLYKLGGEERYAYRTPRRNSWSSQNSSLSSQNSSSSLQSSLSSGSPGSSRGAFSDDQKRLVTAHSDGRVLLWEVGSGYKLEQSVQLPVTGLCRLFRWSCVIFERQRAEDFTCAGISGDGSIVVCGSRHGGVYVWNIDADEGAENAFRALEMHGKVTDVDVSSDGKRFVCRSQTFICAIRVWDRNIGGAIAVPLEMQNEDVECVAISRDGGRVVSGSDDGTIRIWNVGSNTGAVRTMMGHTDRVKGVALSGDGRRIVSASSDSTIRAWNAETGVVIGQPLKVSTFGILEHVSISPDGKMVAMFPSFRSSGTARLVNLEDTNFPLHPDRCTKQVECVAYCGHGARVVTGSTDGRVRVWDKMKGKLIAKSQKRHTEGVSCVAVSADGARIVSGGRDGTVQVWNANDGDAVSPMFWSDERERDIHSVVLNDDISSVAVNDDGTRVLFSTSRRRLAGGVFVWDVDRDPVRVTHHTPVCPPVAMSADGARIAFTSRNRSAVTVWDVRAQQPVAFPLTGHTEAIRSVALSGDGRRVLSASEDCTVRVWDVDSAKAIGHPFVHDSTVVHVRSNRDGSQIVSLDHRGGARMWDVARGQCVTTSDDPDWASQIHRHGLARFSMQLEIMKLMKITRHTGAENDKILAFTDRRVVRVGDVYFAREHNSTFWPFATIDL